MISRSLSIFGISLLASFGVHAQSNLLNAKTPDEIGKKTEAQLNADNDKPLPYGYVHDRDILFGKRVWELIDLNERMNFPLLFPLEDNLGSDRRSLYSTLINAITSGELTEIYDDSYFKNKKTTKELESVFYQRELNDFGIGVLNRYAGTKTEEQLMAEGILTDEHYATAIVEAADILQYQVVGFWYFDKRQAEMKYRILGICPMAIDALSKLRGVESDPIELFWVFFPAARDILHESKAFNDRNSAIPISFDHLLNSRKFSSIIVREENVYGDRAVRDYMRENSLNQLLESNRIKEKIRDFEQDMWNY